MARRTAVSELLLQFLGVFLRIFFKCCNPNCVESVDAAYGCADRVVRWAFFVILLVVKPRNSPNPVQFAICVQMIEFRWARALQLHRGNQSHGGMDGSYWVRQEC